MTLSVDFYGFLVLACLNVKVGSLLPVIAIALKLSLLDQNGRVKKRTISSTALTMLPDQLISFRELFQLSVKGDCFVEHLRLDVVLCSLFELPLQ